MSKGTKNPWTTIIHGIIGNKKHTTIVCTLSYISDDGFYFGERYDKKTSL
jgi:hypothetical protein